LLHATAARGLAESVLEPSVEMPFEALPQFRVATYWLKASASCFCAAVFIEFMANSGD